MFIPSFDLSKPLQFYEGAIRYGCTELPLFWEKNYGRNDKLLKSGCDYLIFTM